MPADNGKWFSNEEWRFILGVFAGVFIFIGLMLILKVLSLIVAPYWEAQHPGTDYRFIGSWAEFKFLFAMIPHLLWLLVISILQFVAALILFGLFLWAITAPMRARWAKEEADRQAVENARIERENREHEAAQARQRAEAQRRQAQAEAERKSRLATLETFMARQWADFSLSRSFTGRDDPAALRTEFQRTEVSRLDPADLALIRQTQNPAIRDVVHPANQLPPPGRS